MIQSTTEIGIPVASYPQTAQTKLPTFFISACSILFQCVAHMCTLASTSIRGGLVPLRHLWAHYYPRVVIGEEGVVMPRSALGFIISSLLAFAEIKSQCQPGFPFKTHPLPIMFSVTSLMMYGLSSAAELIVSATGVDPTSVYAIIAHLGKLGSLCILVASLASLFYT